MWLLLGYLSYILGYPSKYWNYTSKTKIGWVPYSPQALPQWITFLPFISQKILLNIKDVEFGFRTGCILVLFLHLWIINVQFTNLGILNFWIFLFSNIAILAYFDPKLIFLSLKFLKNYIYIQNTGWNNINLHRLGLKSPKFHFFPFLGAEEFIA